MHSMEGAEPETATEEQALMMFEGSRGRESTMP